MKSYNNVTMNDPKIMLRIDSNRIKPVNDFLNLTKIGSSLVLGKLNSSFNKERNVSLNDQSSTITNLTDTPFLGQ
jgi:hypothetical protein